MQRKNKDLTIALAVFVCIQSAINYYLFKGQINSFGSPWLPHYQTIQSIWEMVYQAIPVRWTTVHMIKAGYFPSWTPYPEAGTPLIGKIQNGIFYPFHLIYYLSPERWLPWAFTLAPILSQIFSFACLYLFARLVGLALAPSILAASALVSATWSNPLSSNPVTALFLPILLVLAELYQRGPERSLALWLLPPTMALSFFAGHFETALRAAIMANVYFLIRSFDQSWSHSTRLRHCACYAGAQASGILLALMQILPGMEYVRWSYNRIWRSRLEFGWVYRTINKHLTLEDLPLMLIGLAALAFFLRFFRKALREASAEKLGVYTTASIAAMGIAVAALTQLGLDDTAYFLFHPDLYAGGPCQFAIIFLTLGALYAVLFTDLEPGLKALGGFLLLGSLIRLKTPPLSNLLATLPVIKQFNNTSAAPELSLATCLLGAAAIQHWQAEDFKKRLAAVKRFGLCLVVIAGSWAAARAMKPSFCRFIATGSYTDPNQAPAEGTFMGPEAVYALAGSKQPLRGWGSFPCVGAAVFAVTASGQVAGSANSELLSGLGQCSFYGLLPVPLKALDGYIMAKLLMADGATKVIHGPRLSANQMPFSSLALAAASLPLAALVPWSGPLIYFGAMASWAANLLPQSMEAREFPFRLPGIESLRADTSVFRVDSFQYTFLEADYANMYGLQDIRNGGDNLDVLSTIYFNFLVGSLLAKPDGGPEQSLGLRLLGLANIKYLLDPPNSDHRSPYLEKYYRGEDMVIYKNKLAMPRAAFFDKAMQLPIADITDWDRGRRLAYEALPQLLQQPGFDPQKILILHEAPAAMPPAPATAPARRAAVDIASYEPNRVVLKVEAPRAGYVLLSDNYFPGWEATVNGKPSKILRAFLTFRAVAVPAGRSEVDFVYKPFPLFAGTCVTCLTALVWLGLFFLRGPKIPREITPGQDAPKNKKDLPAWTAQRELELWTARLARGLVAGPMLAAALYWTIWTAFVYHGARATKIAACLVLLAALAETIVVWRGKPTKLPEG